MIVNTYHTRLATREMFQHYQRVLSGYCGSVGYLDSQTINNLIAAGIQYYDTLPIDKLNRWLGFVQAFAVGVGVTTVNVERDFSRPLFHQAYLMDGMPIPPTVDVNGDM